MSADLAGKRALVTGASKGIGLAITRALASAGAEVYAVARCAPSIDPGLGGLVHFVEADLATAAGAQEAVDSLDGPVDILINNVGAVTPSTGGFLQVTDEQWLHSINLNLLSAVRTTRAALPSMMDAGGGVIVTVASVNATLPDPGVIDYSAAKAALRNFCKSLSKEVAVHGIRVNTVSPGPVATDLWLGTDGVAATVAASGGLRAEDVAAEAAAQSLTGRFTRPDEVAELVLFLAGAGAANITGADFIIDGGLVETI